MRHEAGDARAAAEIAVRSAYGRLLAVLARQWRDIAAAEDALADALLTALDHWPRHGVPPSPEGWLMTAAKNNMLKRARRQRLEQQPEVTALFPDVEEPVPDAQTVEDDRLRLMFVCAHPAIDASVRTALILQTVLGLDAGRIARAYLVNPEALTKRLVRAKAKIKATGLRFVEPDAADLPERLPPVLEAIYGAYSLDWRPGGAPGAEALDAEAVFLSGLVAAQLPDQPEALGLHALLLFCEARKPALVDASGDFVPLERQQAHRWNAPFIEQGNALLARAASLGAWGPFQLEAAIQSAHCSRYFSGRTPWADILRLYERLLALYPTLGARIGHAMALAQASAEPARALQLLEDLADGARVRSHQPWWASRAHLLAQTGRKQEAAEAFAQALALTTDACLQRYLRAQLRELRGPLQ